MRTKHDFNFFFVHLSTALPVAVCGLALEGCLALSISHGGPRVIRDCFAGTQATAHGGES